MEKTSHGSEHPQEILMSTPQKSISFAEDREDTEEDVTAVKSFSPASTSKKASSNTKKKLNKETKKSPIQLKTNDKDDRVLDRWLDHFFEGEVRQTLPEGLDDEDSGSDSTSAEELAESSRLRVTFMRRMETTRLHSSSEGGTTRRG